MHADGCNCFDCQLRAALPIELIEAEPLAPVSEEDRKALLEYLDALYAPAFAVRGPFLRGD